MSLLRLTRRGGQAARISLSRCRTLLLYGQTEPKCPLVHWRKKIVQFYTPRPARSGRPAPMLSDCAPGYQNAPLWTHCPGPNCPCPSKNTLFRDTSSSCRTFWTRVIQAGTPSSLVSHAPQVRDIDHQAVRFYWLKNRTAPNWHLIVRTSLTHLLDAALTNAAMWKDVDKRCARMGRSSRRDQNMPCSCKYPEALGPCRASVTSRAISVLLSSRT